MWLNSITALLAAAFLVTTLDGRALPRALSENPINISESIELLPEEGRDMGIDEVRSQSFLRYDEWKGNLMSGETYWGRFEVTNELTVDRPIINWIIEFPIVLTDIELYAFDQEGQMQKGRTGQFVPQDERTVTSVFKSNLVQLYINQGEKETIYFQARSERKHAIPEFDLKIYSAGVFVQNLKNRRFNQGLFIGFMMMMFVYNLFLYFFTAKDKAYLNYSIYIFGIVLYSAYNSGDLADMTNSLFMPNFPKYAYLGKTSTYLVIYGYLHFLQTFLNLDRLLPRWNKLLRVLLWVNLMAFVLDVALMLGTNFNSNISDIVTVGNAIVFVLFIFSFSAVLIRTKARNRYFVISGIMLMGIGAVFTIIARINGVNYSTLPFQIGTILEIIIFSLGLVARRRHIEQEKQQAYFDLERTELLRAQDKIEADRVKELERLKSDLYTNITHEFRTPLQVINGNLEFIQGHENEKEIIKRSSDKMLRLVTQVLDLSQLESQLLQVNLSNSDLIEFIKYITESFHGLAESKSVHLEFRTEERELYMDFDKDKIEHIVYNLISNAIKFTDAGGKIDIHLKSFQRDDRSMILLEVKDNGCGIRRDELELIFDRYHTANNSTSSGIGLAYVQELVQLLGGSISVVSEVDQGTTFSIQLPIIHQADTIKESTTEHTAVLKHDEDEGVDISQEEKYEKPILLLIEDNQDVATYTKRILDDRYQVDVAHNGEEGIGKALELIPDIIISDIMMPKKDGYQVTVALKENYKTSHIPIILLTAKARQPDINKGLSVGADDYLSKPFNKEELLLRLANMDRRRNIMVDKVKAGFFQQNPPNTLSNFPKENEFLKTIKNLVIDNLSDPKYGIDEIRNSLGLSKSQFYRKIKAITDQSPLIFIRDIRLSKALRMLSQSDLNISEVAYSVGFSDPNYFSRVFQKKYGVPPSDYDHVIKNRSQSI